MAWSSPRTWVTSEVVTAAHMNQEVRDNLDAALPDGVTAASWTPTLSATSTNPTTSSVAGREYRIGPLQFVWARFVIATGGSGDYTVTLPTAASGVTASSSTGAGQRIGGFHMRDITVPYMFEGSVLLRTSTVVHFQTTSETGDTDSGRVTHDNPRTWASDDVLSFYAVYPVA